MLSLRAGQVVYGDPDLGLDYSRVVHGEQEFPTGRSGPATGCWPPARWPPRGQGRHELLTLETEVTTEGGEATAPSGATLPSRGTAPPREGRR